MTKAVLGIWALALLWVAVRRPERLAAAAAFCCVFEGAALFSAGGVGLSPYYVALLLVGARCWLVPLDEGRLLGRTAGARVIVGWLVGFAAVAVAGSVVLPRVFAGVGVLSPRLSADSAAPLSFSTSNVGQAAYLCLNALLLWFVAQDTRPAALARGLVAALLAAGAAVVFLALYQLAAAVAGLPFPGDVLYSNDAFVMQAGTSVMGMPRLCGPFTEPASMSVFLVALVAVLTAGGLDDFGGGFASRRGRVFRVALLVAAIAVLVLSTSSTAYVGLAGLAAARVGTHLVWPVLKGQGRPKTMAATLAVLAAVGVAYAASDDLQALVQKMVFDKGESSSFDERSGADAFSTDLARTTLGLGAGLGSNRASSFGPSLLSTVGVPGAALFAGAVWLLIRPIRGALAGPQRALAAGLLAVLGMKLLSSPDLATPALWALMAALVAVRAASEMPSQSSAFLPAAPPAVAHVSTA